MPRQQKPLEEQLTSAQKELEKAEEKATACKQRIVELKQQIEERNMRNAYALLKQNNISVEELSELLLKNTKKK